MKSLERWILFAAIASIAFVSLLYALRFFSSGISADPESWAALGEYFGGILSPILSFLLIILVVNEAMDSRRSVLESKQLQLASQRQIDEQIQLLRPRPELVYYVAAKGFIIYAVLENIGNATAYNVDLSFDFDEGNEKQTTANYEQFKSYHYFPPKYKTSMPVGQLAVGHEIEGISTHTVTIRYSSSPASSETPEEKSYQVDTAMLDTIYIEPDFEALLERIADQLRRLNKNSGI